MSEQSHPAVLVGLDVGKSDHHAVAVTVAGNTVFDKALPNDEARLRDILRDIRLDEAQIAELAVLAGFDDDLAA